jgi:hypothetical protein
VSELKKGWRSTGRPAPLAAGELIVGEAAAESSQGKMMGSVNQEIYGGADKDGEELEGKWALGWDKYGRRRRRSEGSRTGCARDRKKNERC